MQPKELVRVWVDRFNRADVDALVALYEENAINHQVAESPVQGRAAIGRMFRRGFAAAKMACIVENLFQDRGMGHSRVARSAGSAGMRFFPGPRKQDRFPAGLLG